MFDWTAAQAFGVPSAGERWVIRPSAYGLLENASGLLAVVRSRDGTFLPGGGVEGAETPEEAIRREALEECGFLVRVGRRVTHAVQFAYSASERSHFEKRSTFLECAIEGADTTRLQAGHEVLWVDPPSAISILTHESHGWAIQQWRQQTRPQPV